MTATATATLEASRQASIAEFVAASRRAVALAERIAAHLDDHMGASPEAIHWGHVGTANHVENKLAELCKDLGIDAEV